jgi:hypothetical protein
LLAEGFVNRRYRSWGYLEREDDLFIRRGVLIKRLSIVPYGRMQFVDVTAGVVERMFGIATVRLHTAAAATDARLPGLAVSEAARLRERLTSCQGTAGTPRRRTGLLHLGGQQFSKWTDRTPPLPTTHEGVICCLTVLVGS